MRYGISAARLPPAPNAAAIRSAPASAGASGILREDLGEVLVAASTQRDEGDRVRRNRIRLYPCNGVRGLERRDDSLQPRELAERAESLGVGHRLIAHPAFVAKEGVLGADARIVEAR